MLEVITTVATLLLMLALTISPIMDFISYIAGKVHNFRHLRALKRQCR